MASWVTHLIVADKVLEQITSIDRHGFCVGNIAPDCNVENADWTDFTPPRKITHWMSGERKVASDCDEFYKEYILKRQNEIHSNEQYAFLLGYYSHLITDASYQQFIRDEKRVKNLWSRINANEDLRKRAYGYPQDYDSVKKIIPKMERLYEVYVMEAEYLQKHPDSGYITEIMPLKEFPDYIDYLPHGCIVRKVGVMGYWPQTDPELKHPIAMSREEFSTFTESTTELVMHKFHQYNLLETSFLRV